MSNYMYLLLLAAIISAPKLVEPQQQLRFNKNGEFKLLQVADMHYANGESTTCLDVLPSQLKGCSDLNTTAFLERLIRAENPDLIVFTGDNIFGRHTKDPVKSMNEAFEAAVSSNTPWAAVLGNHDQESTLSRAEVMKYIVTMKNTLSQFNPPEAHEIDGYGNYNLEVGGVEGSTLQNKSVLNLYLLDSGDYSTVWYIPGYGWIKDSQQDWFQTTSYRLGESISAPLKNSGFFNRMVEAGDVKAVFIGHDHKNDFCGRLSGIHLCYAGGFGYHAYGKAGWARRARVVTATLEKTNEGGSWGPVKSIKTWKRLDDENLSTSDAQILWSKSSSGNDNPFKALHDE